MARGSSCARAGSWVAIVLLVACGARKGRGEFVDVHDWGPSPARSHGPTCTHELSTLRDPEGMLEPPSSERFPDQGVILDGQWLSVPWMSRSAGVIVTMSWVESGLALDVHDFRTGALQSVIPLGRDYTQRLDRLDDATLLDLRPWGEPPVDSSEARAELDPWDAPPQPPQRGQLLARWSEYMPLENGEIRALEQIGALADDAVPLVEPSTGASSRYHDYRLYTRAGGCSGCLCGTDLLFEYADDEQCHVRINAELERPYGVWVSADAPGVALVVGLLVHWHQHALPRSRWVITLDGAADPPIALNTTPAPNQRLGASTHQGF